MTFKTDPVNIILLGHSIMCAGILRPNPHVTGTFAADPVTGSDGEKYGVFTVSDDGTHPVSWCGVYYLAVSGMQAYCPHVFAEL